MDEAELEVRLSARLHARFDGGEPSEALLRRIAEVRRVDRGPIHRRAAPWALAAVIALVVLAGFALIASQVRPGISGPSLSPATSASAASPSPSAAADVPYRIRVRTLPGSPGPVITIAAPSDCSALPTDWLDQICSLTLRPDWQSIIASTDPFGPPLGPTGGKTPAEIGTPTWWAALTRANLDGDPTFCSDASARSWVTRGSGLGAAPEPGSTPAPLHPVASCLNAFRRTVSQGSFTLIDSASPLSPTVLTFFVAPGASARVGVGSAPAFDPAFGCYPGTTRETCNALLAAVTPVLGDRRAQVERVGVRAGSFECTTSASPCPPPPGGTWLGNVVALTGDSTGFAFDVAEIGGQVVVTEVPYTP
ncbi:MAG TPA: hypothetical protein VKR24_06115 [Candidatus Limnocylindrales bacterium]|nr:hypothetical protein [Candidatus Limnocylindrales bacterium]